MSTTTPTPPPKVRSFVEKFCVMLATGFFASYIPAKLVTHFDIRWQGKALTDEKWTGAGLVGSVWGTLTYLLLPPEFAGSYIILSLAILSSVAIGHIAEKSMGVKDDPRIVIDEWVGTWIAMFGLPQVFSTELFSAFVLFRVFDVIKGPWGHSFQKWPGGLGVVMDDVGAGVIAFCIMRLFI